MISDVFFLGWDVGPWKCTGDSKDALHVLRWSNRRMTSEGQPFRGNILRMTDGGTGIDDLLQLVQVKVRPTAKLVIAIDAVFGWPKQFIGLTKRRTRFTPECSFRCRSTHNRYLYRETERFLDDKLGMGSNMPKTAVGGRIGNAGTKAQYFINRIRGTYSCYVPPFDQWDPKAAGASEVTLIEVYPGAAKCSKGYRNWMKHADGKLAAGLGQGDETDAIHSALVAGCYAETVGMISGGFPPVWVPTDASGGGYDLEAITREGWIFTPKQTHGASSRTP
jgi:hypothetical protein